MARDGKTSKHRQPKPSICPKCSILVKRDLDRHMKIHSPAELVCPYCGMRNRQMSNLISHIHAKHLDDRPWKCPYTVVSPTGGRVPCSEAFNSPAGLTKHKQCAHADDPPPTEKAPPMKYGFDLSDPAQRVFLHHLVIAINNLSHPAPASAPAPPPPPPTLGSPSLQIPSRGWPVKQEEVDAASSELEQHHAYAGPEPSQSHAQHEWPVPEPASRPSNTPPALDNSVASSSSSSLSPIPAPAAPIPAQLFRFYYEQTHVAEPAAPVMGMDQTAVDFVWVPDRIMATPSASSSGSEVGLPDSESDADVFDRFNCT